MKIDLEVMRKIVTESYFTTILSAYGEDGVSTLELVLEAVTKIFQKIEPAVLEHPIVVFRIISDEKVAYQALAANLTCEIVSRPETLVHKISGACAVEVLDRGNFAVIPMDQIDLAKLSASAIVYKFEGGLDSFIIRGTNHSIRNPSPSLPSVFAKSTFTSLAEALDDYRDRLVRSSGCYIFQTVWADCNRLFLKAKPEWRMRDSLEQFLRIFLRDSVVRPEQNVDKSHPVDIKVTWDFTNREALIEIKWLGDSIKENGDISTKYRDARANEGAEQLADYLDANRVRSATRIQRGYLVVIDARRRGLTKESKTISNRNGMHYVGNEIVYEPAYHEIRDDFEKPIRMFAEPLCAPA